MAVGAWPLLRKGKDDKGSGSRISVVILLIDLLISNVSLQLELTTLDLKVEEGVLVSSVYRYLQHWLTTLAKGHDFYSPHHRCILIFWNEIGRCLGSRNSFLSFSFSLVRHLRSLRDCTPCTDLTWLTDIPTYPRGMKHKLSGISVLVEGGKTSYATLIS